MRFSYPTIDVSEPLTRDAFEHSSQSKTDAIVAELDATLARAGFGPDAVDIVCCRRAAWRRASLL